MKKLKPLISFIIILSAFAIVLTGCGGGGDGTDGTNPTLVSISVTPANPSIAIGTTQQFTATGTYSDSSTQNITASVTWSSSDITKATISNAGLATAVAAGSTTITATSGSISGSTTLTVTATGGSSINLPKTGQTTSYGTGDDGALKKGVAWPSPRFTVGTGAEADCVTDNLTGLMWVKAPDSATRTWTNALAYANGLSLCGYTDWRLPNRKEWRSLIDYSNYNLALPTGYPFTNVQGGVYWSSTTVADGTDSAWIVNMFSGYVVGGPKDDGNYVWPVRSGQYAAPADLPETGQTTCYDAAGTVIACGSTGQDGDIKAGVAWPTPRFTVGTGAEADCVTDNLTGLMWVKAPDSTTRTWANALTYANDLSLCGYPDWRLPNVNELESLINAEQANSATWLNTQGFTNVQAYLYWSSTTRASLTGIAWVVYMWDGGVSKDVGTKDNNYYVWPVRAGE